MSEYGLLPFYFSRKILRVTTWPVLVSETIGHLLEHVEYSQYKPWKQWCSQRLITVPHNLPKRDKESHHRPGRVACFIHCAQQAQSRFFIPPTVSGAWSYVRNDFKFLYFRELVDIHYGVCPSPDWSAFDIDLLALESPYNHIYWNQRKSERRVRYDSDKILSKSI